MEDIILTREELYELVWSTPMIQLAKKYKISDNGLRKKCKNMNIPTPDSGYWTKLKFNKPVKKKKLPKSYEGKNEVNLSERDDDEPESNSIVSQRCRLAKSYKELDQSYFKVPDKLTSPDKLIVAAKNVLSKEKINKWSRHPFISTHGEALNIHVSPHNVGRALRFYDALIKLLKYKNYNLIFENRRTYAVVKDVEFEIYLREKLRVEKVQEGNWTTSKFFSSNKLIFKIDSYPRREIIDGSKKIEERLADILADLELRAEKEIKWRIESEKRRKIKEEKERIEKELRERKEKEISDFKNLLSLFDRWQQARNLREYILAIEEKRKRDGKLSEEQKEWIEWANQKADWYDPLIDQEDPLLGPFKPELIEEKKEREGYHSRYLY